MNTKLITILLGVIGLAAFAESQTTAKAPPPETEAPAATEAPPPAATEIPAPAATEAPPSAATEAPAPAAAEATPPTAAEAPVATGVLQSKNIDEIDLEDDSAIAAKKPTVKGNIDKGFMSLVDIECDEATLADILRQFRKTTGANIISDDSTNLQKRVSVSLKKVPWLQGMTAILGSRGFRIEEHDNIYRVIEDFQQIPVSTRTYPLNHASAKELADLFNATYGKKDNTGRLISPIATCFNGANVVVVTATDKMLSECEAIIRAVDKAVAQIYIEARFIELSNEAMHKLGIDWSQLKEWSVRAEEMSAGMEYNNGRFGKYAAGEETTWYEPQTFNAEGKNISSGKSEINYITKKTLVPGSINAAPGAGRTGNDMAWHNARGFSGQLTADAFKLTMSAFEKMEDVKIFSNPKIIVSNGKEATVDMTTKFPNIELASQRNTSASASYLDMTAKIMQIPGEDANMFAKSCFYSWGIQLSVKPRISPDGLISVEIIPTISQLDTDVTKTGFYQVQNGDNDSSIGMFPIINVKRLTTEFTMKDGSTAVIGGLSKTTEEDIDSGIPYLREIPWIGPKLFGWKSRGKVQKEIIVCVTVGIADPADLPKDIGLPKNAILGREYVTGAKLEPGDRPDNEAMKLDMSPVDKRSKPTGEVKITPVTE